MKQSNITFRLKINEIRKETGNILSPQAAAPGTVWRCGGAGQHQIRAGSVSSALLALLLLQYQERCQIHGQGRLSESTVQLE